MLRTVRNGDSWFVTTDQKSECGSYIYLHRDGHLRPTTVYNGKTLGWYKTREEVRRAIRLYRTIQKRSVEKEAVVSRGLNQNNELICIRFNIKGGPSGSEPILDRGLEATLIQVGMVLKHYGVTDFTFEG